jgi:copper homeostasis protein
MTDRILVEVCLDSADSVAAAARGGADRVELCANLLEGGTTPSAGEIREARRAADLGLMVMIRPRGGDFVYTDREFAAMEHDVGLAKELGADGVVFGLLMPDGAIDAERTARLIDLARPMAVTVHRAFDMTRDPFEALETLVGLGVERILTSGQEPTVLEGVELIAELVKRAGDRLTILPGCGITPRNLERIVRETGVTEVHVVGNEVAESKMEHRNARVYMGTELRAPEYSRVVTSAQAVGEMVRRLRT